MFVTPAVIYTPPPMMVTISPGFMIPMPPFDSYVAGTSQWDLAPVCPPRAATDPSEPDTTS